MPMIKYLKRYGADNVIQFFLYDATYTYMK
jgi:hypothetical protein